jgi:hypothetical protein
MADLDYDHYDDGFAAASSGNRFGKYAHLGGAALSVALVLGGGVWGYQIAMRDVTGIPVIRAADAPMRMAPANPGGTETSHQGLSVNAVAAAGMALPLPESLTLAPKPQELAEEDLAGLQPMDETLPAVAAIDPAAVAVIDATEMPEVLPETQEDAVAAALAEALGLEEPVVETAAGDVARPEARPETLSADVNNVTEVSAPAAEIDPATIAAGTMLVQLGAFDDQDLARGEWARLTTNFAELLAGKSMVIQPAQSGGKTFFRLRAHGFASDDDTRRFCTAMLAENATCIPVAQR